MNTQIVEEVKQLIRQEPRRLQMGSWLYESEVSPCGTAGCLAGWIRMAAARHQFDPDKQEPEEDWVPKAHEIVEDDPNGFHADAAKILGVEYSDANKLFYVGLWPEPFRKEYMHCNFNSDMQGKAEAVCNRLDHFVKTGE